MSIAEFAILTLFIAGCAANILAEHIGNRLWQRLTKPLLIPLLLLFYLLSARGPDPLLIAALICGFLGDVLLLGSGRLFMAGLLSFMAGHIFYIIVFLLPVGWHQVPVWVVAPAAVYLAFAALLLRRLLPGLAGMRLPAFAYLACILLMSFSALLRAAQSPCLQTMLPFAGSLLFIASDSLLSLDCFAGKKVGHGTAIMATYLLAQSLITAGFIV